MITNYIIAMVLANVLLLLAIFYKSKDLHAKLKKIELSLDRQLSELMNKTDV